jgi:DNA modification methylase
METEHKIYYSNSESMDNNADASVDLVVTSPPYPMIEMWDEMFCSQSKRIRNALSRGDGETSFELMHGILDVIWNEVYRVLKIGGFACINIGDATRTINGNFVLYPNHMRILKALLGLRFTVLPCILWRKQTNAPNKFMGSGMLPAGAYVTLEHEYILIVRKGPKRDFSKAEDKKRRHSSALFWEERNIWYSDVWYDVKGIPQAMNDKDARLRSGAYPFELVYRLINMYSVKGDVVLDPFLGTGSTTAAAIVAARNSVGYEVDPSLQNVIKHLCEAVVESSPQLIRGRLSRHCDFVSQWLERKGDLKHRNIHYGFPVVTSQERGLLLNDPQSAITNPKGVLKVQYSESPQEEFCKDWSTELQNNAKPVCVM